MVDAEWERLVKMKPKPTLELGDKVTIAIKVAP